MSKYKFEFYVPKSEVIPTGLTLRVNGKEYEVSYTRLGDCLGYKFSVLEMFKPLTVEIAKEIVDAIVDIMKSQSYDHGVEWRTTEFTYVEVEERYKATEDFIVKFRVKDCY